MADMFRVVTEWSGFTGAPGYTNLFFRNYVPGGAPTGIDDRASAIGAHERVYTMWNAIKAYFPDEVRLNVSPIVDVLDDASGDLLDSHLVPAKPILSGADVGNFSSASGAVVGWRTSTIRNKRRIRGQMFLVPLGGAAFHTSGRVGANVADAIQAAATSMAIGGVNSTFGVWARPVVATEKNPDVVERDGQWAEVTGVRVTTLAAVLRSRRD